MGVREIRERRKAEAMAGARRYDKQTMCELLGITYPTWCKLEDDPGRMTVEQASKVASHLGVSVEDLFA